MHVTIPCHCPVPHDSDTVTFRTTLGFTEATAIVNSTQLVEEREEPMRSGLILALMSKFCILYGVESWTLTDDAGTVLPVDRQTITARLLEDSEIASYLVDPAVDLYQRQVIDPLTVRVASSSQRSQMVASTSRTRSSSRTRKQRKPSSISTIPTDDTETTSPSPDGAYSSSQSLELAAS